MRLKEDDQFINYLVIYVEPYEIHRTQQDRSLPLSCLLKTKHAMTIYRFKIYNSIGNILNIGKYVGSRSDLEEYCKKQIQDQRKNTPCNWMVDIEELPRTIKPRCELES